MSVRNPIVAITGSSGAGTSTVLHAFRHIFRREKLRAQIIHGDSFHRFDREEMNKAMKASEKRGNKNFSHLGPSANLLEDLETLFRTYGETGEGKFRRYLHDSDEAAFFKQDAGTFTPWEEIKKQTDLLFYEGLHGGRTALPRAFGECIFGRRRGFGVAIVLVLRGHRPISTASSIYSVALQTVSRRWRGARPNLKAA